MLAVVESTPDMWRDSFAAARAAALPAWSVANVVVCGMGGSGISGDVLSVIASTRAAIPVAVVKGVDLPRWAGDETLVICVSYSGDTEETLACFDVARNRGAQLAVVAAGGALEARAAETGVPCIVPTPGGLMPRAAFAALAASVLVVGERAGLVPDLDGEINAALDACREGLGRWRAVVRSDENDAKRLAHALVGTRPHIWRQEGVLGVAASRWKTQLNENAKLHASSAVMPEALHNEIVPLDPGDALVILRAEIEKASIAARIDALASYEPWNAWSFGTSDLAILASSVLFGDLVSVYCAALRGVDPTPIEPIKRLKQALG
ncbi:MAG: SIS domain-containing protein [Actinomycetota bacterium]